MQLECSNCQKILNLPDAKLPVGRPFTFTCPHCRQKNSAIIPVSEEAPPQPEMTQPPTDPQSEDHHRRSTDIPGGDRRQSSVKDRRQSSAEQPPRPGPSYLGADENFSGSAADGHSKALVVYDDEQIGEALAAKLEALGFEATVAVNLRDAAKHLKFASFDIALVQEDYYGASLVSNHLLKSIQNLDSQTRRAMRVVLISPTMTTLDDLLAFSLSFDAVVNKADLETIDRILMSVMARAKKFYAVYREILTEHGFD
ncbi:MAG: hypothetical protein LBV79_07400 [Candidatus Adiutrix sp.]|jgi:CheY-like chemotaxis protein|nr:hypothetical protein [Candidatus Adiutrix sp.]